MRNSILPLASNDDGAPESGRPVASPSKIRPSKAQRAWLRRGLGQPGGKLPLFDQQGQSVSPRVVKACLDKGWAEPWFSNPLKPDWLICKLTESGRGIAGGSAMTST
jgi:hypothetical protein